MDDENKIYSFRDLKIWQKGLDITKEIYALTNKFPKEEIFGLVSQMRRAAVSIPSNIAEGRGGGSRKDFAQFLHIAVGSMSELETQLLIAYDLFKFEVDKIIEIIHEEQRMTISMIHKLKAKS